jgi:hypothetical protein
VRHCQHGCAPPGCAPAPASDRDPLTSRQSSPSKATGDRRGGHAPR